MKTLVVVNPQARGGEVGQSWTALEAEVRAAIGTPKGNEGFEAVLTSQASDVSRVIRERLKTGTERVIVVGGDGTLSEGVQGFFESEKPIAPHAVLGILPAGRGDDFFKSLTGERSLSTSHAWKLGLRVLHSGQPRPMDCARIRWISARAPSSCIFINIASFGYPGLLVQKVHMRAGVIGRSRLGKSALAYLAQSLSAMGEYKPVRVQVDVDGARVFDGPIFSGLVLNGYYNAGGVRWSRQARIDDGQLELLLTKPRSPLASALSLPRMASGNWTGASGAQIFSGKRIRIQAIEETQRGYPLFEVDGDQPEPADAQGAEIEVLPGVLNILSLSNS